MLGKVLPIVLLGNIHTMERYRIWHTRFYLSTMAFVNISNAYLCTFLRKSLRNAGPITRPTTYSCQLILGKTRVDGLIPVTTTTLLRSRAVRCDADMIDYSLVVNESTR